METSLQKAHRKSRDPETVRGYAEVAGREHDNVLKSIRSMEAAWEKVTGVKFNASEYEDSTGRRLPMYELTKSESLYIATKFNDEARARLVIRWENTKSCFFYIFFKTHLFLSNV